MSNDVLPAASVLSGEALPDGVQFVDPIESTDTYEWRCTRCGDYIISRKRPKCENCDESKERAELQRRGFDILRQPHERNGE